MKKIAWTDSYSVGIEKIDKQHKQLVEMINQLIDAHDTSVRSEMVSDTLTSMTNYAMSHFQTEEDLLREHQYPQYDDHHTEHMAFIRKTAEMASAAIKLEQSVPVELLSYLKEWLINHILKSDMQYKVFFSEKGIEFHLFFRFFLIPV